jgi:endonuclease YncB( thermonuclease family)
MPGTNRESCGSLRVKNKLISFYLFLLILLCGLFFSASAANDITVPVTGELLRSLGLDREYHKCISVADGDTLTLEGLGTVRFVGVAVIL